MKPHEAAQLFLDGVPLPPSPQAPPVLDRAAYMAECEKRWSGPALQDARSNWSFFKELGDDLIESLRVYASNPFLADVAGREHNPTGRLADFLWSQQAAWNPDRRSLYPFLDFEERHQKVFLKRGLLIFCEMILRQLECTEPKEAMP